MIQRKKKICKGCGKSKLIWSNGNCQACASRRPKKSSKKTPVIHDDWGFASQREMFLHLWEELEVKKCWLSGKTLDFSEGHPQFYHLFAHILPKGKFPLYKLNPNNIRIVHPEIHSLYDQGTEAQRKDYGVDFTPIYNLKTQLFIEYQQFLKQRDMRVPIGSVTEDHCQAWRDKQLNDYLNQCDDDIDSDDDYDEDEDDNY